MKLNLGAGGAIKPQDEGWVNVDVRDLPGIDLIHDIELDDLPYEPDSIEHINMQDFLEHLSRWRQEPFLKHIFDILEPGGDCFIQVPHLRVNAERYLGILKNPTELQNKLDGNSFAGTMYGGQEYAENYHKWAYDEISLIKALNKAGLLVSAIGSDGGMNMLCAAFKPPDSVYLHCGGGLGDVIQTYLSNPADDFNNPYPDDEFPSTMAGMSRLFRRLPAIKKMYPYMWIKVVVKSHNKVAKELFEFHPCIDEIIELPSGEDENITKWNGDNKQFNKEVDAYNIQSVFDYNLRLNNFLEVDVPIVYLNEDEHIMVDKISNLKYVVFHPYAGMAHRAPVVIEDYELLSDMLGKQGYYTVVLGGTKDKFEHNSRTLINLVGKASVRASTALALNCNGFIGGHSCMVLPAWFHAVKTVCIVPPYHDGGQPWEEFWNSKNPTAWGAHKPFNKTVMTEPGKRLGYKVLEEIVDWITL